MKKLKNKKKIIGWIVFAVILIGVAVLSISLKGWNVYGIEFFFKTVLLENFLGINALLLGFLTLIGYLLLGRGVINSILGCLKTIIGILVLTIGSGMLVGLATPIFRGIKESFGGGSVVPLDPYMGWTSANTFLEKGISTAANYVSWVSFAMILGFFVNIILIALKRWTNVYSLMITGHVMFQQTAFITAIIYVTLFGGFSKIAAGQQLDAGRQIGVILLSGITSGLFWGVASNTTIKGTNRITNNAGFAVGHQQMFGAALAYKLGRFFGKAENSAETRKLSKKFKIFEDNIFVQSLIVFILFMVLIFILRFGSKEGWDPTMKDSSYGAWKIAGGAYWVINMFLGSLKIVASILVITTGVRMFVSELQQAFQGISQKVIPGAVVAVDCAATYGFSANSVTYGFVSGVIAQFVAVGIVIGISFATHEHFPIVIPLFITLFFNSGTLGAFANASGGFKAAIIVPAICGFLEIFTASCAIYSINGAFARAIEGGTVLKNASSPVATGFNGLFDSNFPFGILFSISGINMEMAWIAFGIYWILLLVIAQLTDTTKQSKKTFLQKIFKLNPKLVNQENIEKKVAT